MDEITANTVLDEVVGPVLATDEGQTYLEAQERQMEVLVSYPFPFSIIVFS